MPISDDSIGSLARPREALACDEAATIGPRRVEDDLRGARTWRGPYSPTQVTQPVDREALMPPVRRQLVSPVVGRISKTMLCLGIVAAVGFVPLQGLLETSSVEAVINARVTTLRAPTDGEVQPGPNPLVFSTSLARGDVLLRIINRRADRSRVDDLTHQIEQLKDERSGIAARLANARVLLNDLTEQTRLFSDARILQLEARQGELEADVAAARARTDEAKTSLDRFMTLAGKGWLPRAQLNQAKRDGLVAEKLETAAQKRLEAVGIELAAAQRGVFVGANNNDRPRYMQRVDELEQQASNLAETLAERDQRMIRLNDKLAEEKARFNALHAADVVAPTKGSVWDILTAPEEQVHRGQDLLRMLDCSEPVVTAVVGEAVSSRIQVGAPVRFRPRDGREELPGTVIHLSAAPLLPANLAIPSSALTPGSYHITVAVPKLAQGCLIGRTGRVFFDWLNGPLKGQVLSLPGGGIVMGEMTGRRHIEHVSKSALEPL